MSQERYDLLMQSLERDRRRRTAAWLAKWAAIRLVVCATVGVLTGYNDLAFAAWAVLTMGHIDRCLPT